MGRLRRVLVAGLVALVVAGCGTDAPPTPDTTEPAAAITGSATDPTPSTGAPVEPGDAGGESGTGDAGDEPGPGDAGDEPGTGTAVTLDLTTPVELGEAIRVPVLVAVGPDEPSWDDARVSVEVEGPASADLAIDTDDLAPGSSTTGELLVEVPAGTVDAPGGSRVAVTLHLQAGGDEIVRRRDTLAVVTGPDRAWLAHGSTAEARRAMLGDLVAEGKITQAEHDAAVSATTESTGRGSVQVVTPSDAPD